MNFHPFSRQIKGTVEKFVSFRYTAYLKERGRERETKRARKLTRVAYISRTFSTCSKNSISMIISEIYCLLLLLFLFLLSSRFSLSLSPFISCSISTSREKVSFRFEKVAYLIPRLIPRIKYYIFYLDSNRIRNRIARMRQI